MIIIYLIDVKYVSLKSGSWKKRTSCVVIQPRNPSFLVYNRMKKKQRIAVCAWKQTWQQSHLFTQSPFPTISTTLPKPKPKVPHFSFIPSSSLPTLTTVSLFSPIRVGWVSAALSKLTKRCLSQWGAARDKTWPYLGVSDHVMWLSFADPDN